MVLIENESLKRVDWPLSFIEEVFPGKNGKILVVKLRTAYGTNETNSKIVSYGDARLYRRKYIS